MIELLLHCLQARPQLKIPGQRELAAIASTCGPATILYVAKTSAYLLIQATATSLSTLALAAHQPVWSVWGLVSSPTAATVQLSGLSPKEGCGMCKSAFLPREMAYAPQHSVWLQGSFCQTPMEQAALAFLPSAKTAEDVRETVTGDMSKCCSLLRGRLQKHAAPMSIYMLPTTI